MECVVCKKGLIEEARFLLLSGVGSPMEKEDLSVVPLQICLYMFLSMALLTGVWTPHVGRRVPSVCIYESICIYLCIYICVGMRR